MWSLFNPVTIRFGRGSLAALAEILPQNRLLIVTGKSSTRQKLEEVLKRIPEQSIEIFDQVEANPSAETVESGIRFCRKRGCSAVLGFGGGSPLDCAKAIAFLANKNASVLDVMHKKSESAGKGLPFIAIPTTAGSGSEVTPYSILTDTQAKKKISIAHPALYPVAAILDPDLTLSMPAQLTASTGLDVLAHAIESAWSRFTNEVARTLALEASRLVFRHLEIAVRNGADSSAREGMMLASMMAGMAISSTGTTINHSISYPLTLGRGVPHGFACALSLPVVMRYNLKAAQEILDRMAWACGFEKATEFIDKVEQLLRRLGAPLRLRELGLGEADVDWLTNESYGKNAARNPRAVDPADMRKIILDLL